MSQVFVIRNQLGLYLSKQRDWITGQDPNPLYRTVHRDEALNTVFEVSSKDILLRAVALECPLSEKGQPVVEPGDPALVQASRDTSDASVEQKQEPVAGLETAPGDTISTVH